MVRNFDEKISLTRMLNILDIYRILWLIYFSINFVIFNIV